MNIQAYINEIRVLFASGQTTEHSFRPALLRLFQGIDPALTVINEPKRLTDVGAPDFVFNRGEVPVGWCEAKDIDKDVRKFAANDYSREQKVRYSRGLPNLIYTNGLDFEFLRNGQSVGFVSVAELRPGLPERPAEFASLETYLRDFAAATPISITSAKRLAEMMAAKAAIIKDIMGRALAADQQASRAGARASDLLDQYEEFQRRLIRDISVEEFADVYAETIAYGLFAARLHDTTPGFSRTEALDLLPKSNPFLRELFLYIAGPSLDERLRRVIDELCHLFAAADLPKILANFGKASGRQDPFLHFYEDFLAEYNPDKRKARGVWYTPAPVVNFIVRAVDEVLKSEFGLADGLADTSRITIQWDTGQTDRKGKPATIKKEVHRVQVLDPATGTGTFLAEVVKLVSERVKDVAPGQWSSYVERELLPRLHGFELLVASYAMCHLKLDLLLTQTGYQPTSNPPRLGVYLTNSLDEGERVEQSLFGRLGRAIAYEAMVANEIKRQMPVMCIVGNPPYSGVSQNNGDWITGLIEDYKFIDGVHFGEKKHWLQDDYVKFIRFAEHMIEQNGEGVLAFITNHGYLANPTFRGMRWHLRQTFDRIHVIDLHGNANKKEVSPDGTPDRNVFDIMQGVAIIVAVKRRHQGKGAKPPAEVRHGELWGSREQKNEALWEGSVPALASDLLPHKPPQHPFVTRSYDGQAVYDAGFQIGDLMPLNAAGIVSMADDFIITEDRDELKRHIDYLLTSGCTAAVLQERFGLGKNYASWAVEGRGQVVFDEKKIVPIGYRPFDRRWTYFDARLLWRRREHVTRQFLDGPNLGLSSTRTIEGGRFFADVLVHDLPITHHTLSIKEVNYIAPLYLYPEPGVLDRSVRVNMDEAVYRRIREAAGLTGSPHAPDGTDSFRRAIGEARPDEVKVFDYVYGVLHCPSYRQTFAEFLKRDFPRIPFPPSPEVFRSVSEKGESLRRLHLMEPAAIGATVCPFEGEGDSIVDKPRMKDGRVWVNDTQSFAKVPVVAWELQIGGYQPAQKWLKDRKGSALGWDDVRHYQRILKILVETDRIMREIELPIAE